MMNQGKSQRGSQSYRSLIKTIKKRVNKLRNEKMKQEAKKINQFATKRAAVSLSKLKEYFEKHFAHSAQNHPEPEELVNIPDFIKELQTKYTQPVNMGPPCKK